MTCKAIWLKRLLKDLQEEVSDPTTIYCDNLNSIQLANPIRRRSIAMTIYCVRTLFSTPGPSTSRCTIISSESVSFPVKSN